MNHGKFVIEWASKWSDNEERKKCAENKSVSYLEFGLTANYDVSGEKKSGGSDDDIYEAEDNVWAELKLVVKKIYDSPGVHIGDAAVEIKSVDGVIEWINDETGAKIVSALPDVFARSGEQEITNDKENYW